MPAFVADFVMCVRCLSLHQASSIPATLAPREHLRLASIPIQQKQTSASAKIAMLAGSGTVLNVITKLSMPMVSGQSMKSKEVMWRFAATFNNPLVPKSWGAVSPPVIAPEYLFVPEGVTPNHVANEVPVPLSPDQTSRSGRLGRWPFEPVGPPQAESVLALHVPSGKSQNRN